MALVSKPTGGEALRTKGGAQQYDSLDPWVGGLSILRLYGNPGGSLEATRRSFNKDFLLALAADFRKHGAAAIEKVRKQQPAAYTKICAHLVPREMQVEHSGGIKAMTTEQIERAIEIIKELIAKRDAAANAKVIEGQSEAVPSLPAPGSISGDGAWMNFRFSRVLPPGGSTHPHPRGWRRRLTPALAVALRRSRCTPSRQLCKKTYQLNSRWLAGKVYPHKK